MSETPIATESAAPSYELWIAFGVSVTPHVIAFVGGHGYGEIFGNLPLAIGLTIVDIAAIVIAFLQSRDDTRANRSSHWLVWATIALGLIWVAYAVFVGLVVLIGEVFCFNQFCRGPLQ